MEKISNRTVSFTLIVLGAIISCVPASWNPACHEVGTVLISAGLAIYKGPSTEENKAA
jgi:hypothetical protein